MADSNKTIEYVAGKISVWAFTAWQLPAYTPWTNDDVVKTAIENDITFYRLLWVQNLKITTVQENPVSLVWDECDTWEMYNSLSWKTWLSAELIQAWDIEAKSIILWTNPLDITWASTPVVAEALGTWWTVWTPIRLKNENWDKTIIDLTAVWAIKAWGSNLVRWTDFNDYVNDWVTYIVPVTAQTLAITADYSYTPLTAQYQWLLNDTSTLPYLIVKIEWCVDVNWKVDTHYIVKSKIDSDWVNSFVNPANAWEVPLPTIEIANVLWWYWLAEHTRDV